jgi:hypothetical protein
MDSRHARVLLAIGHVDDGSAHELSVEVDCEFNASKVVFETFLQVQLHSEGGAVDGFDKCARSFATTVVGFGVLKLLESMSVDGNRHLRRREAGGAHGGDWIFGYIVQGSVVVVERRCCGVLAS